MEWAGEEVRNKAERLGLQVVHVPIDIACVVEEQVRPIVEWHAFKFQAGLSVREQMDSLAFDAYTQGLIDGNQIPHVQHD